jgi:hypothetical protein
MIALAILAVAILGAAVARGDVVEGANVKATFHGWLTPRALPRSGLAPVTLHMQGALSSVEQGELPRLEKVEIAINRHGKVFTAGLPTCPKRKIQALSSEQALEACRGALIGGGHFEAHILIPAQAPFPAQGKMLAFNSVVHGHHVILAHIYGINPVPTSRVLEMTFQHPSQGSYGTTLSLTLPTISDNWGHVTGFRMNLHRNFSFRGKQRSFISAGCPAPRGFDIAYFKAARGTYFLADGRQLTRVLEGTCRVAPK